MSLYKFLIGTTLLLVSALLIGGLYYPNNFVMLLADTSITFAIVRAILCILLIGLLVTNPPRSLLLRGIVGAGSVLLFSTTAFLLLDLQMSMLDAIVFLEVAVIFGIEALESRKKVIPVRERRTAVQKIPVYTN